MLSTAANEVIVRKAGGLFPNCYQAVVRVGGEVTHTSRIHPLKSAFRAARWYMGTYHLPINYRNRIVQVPLIEGWAEERPLEEIDRLLSA